MKDRKQKLRKKTLNVIQDMKDRKLKQIDRKYKKD